MAYSDWVQIFTLTAYLILFFGRTIGLRRQGTKVLVIGSGKQGFPALLEKSMIAFLGLALGMHVQIRNEEVFLLDQYGEPYRRYRAQVNRYI